MICAYAQRIKIRRPWPSVSNTPQSIPQAAASSKEPSCGLLCITACIHSESELHASTESFNLIRKANATRSPECQWPNINKYSACKLGRIIVLKIYHCAYGWDHQGFPSLDRRDVQLDRNLLHELGLTLALRTLRRFCRFRGLCALRLDWATLHLRLHILTSS